MRSSIGFVCWKEVTLEGLWTGGLRPGERIEEILELAGWGPALEPIPPEFVVPSLWVVDKNLFLSPTKYCDLANYMLGLFSLAICLSGTSVENTNMSSSFYLLPTPLNSSLNLLY